MCFSASASFTAGVALLAIGVVTVRRARRQVELPFALIPAFFGFQQLLEGGLWLSFADKAPLLNAVLTQLYSVFSQVFWPVYIPVAVLLIEPVCWRRRLIGVIALAGVVVALFLLRYLVRLPVVAQVSAHHIVYVFPHFHEVAATGLYLLGACVSPLCSSHRSARLFGVAASLSLLATYLYYFTWFISVWCFFAALLSAIVLLFFPPRGSMQGRAELASPPATDGPGPRRPDWSRV